MMMKLFKVSITFDTGRTHTWEVLAEFAHLAVKAVNDKAILCLYGEVTNIEVKS